MMPKQTLEKNKFRKKWYSPSLKSMMKKMTAGVKVVL